MLIQSFNRATINISALLFNQVADTLALALDIEYASSLFNGACIIQLKDKENSIQVRYLANDCMRDYHIDLYQGTLYKYNYNTREYEYMQDVNCIELEEVVKELANTFEYESLYIEGLQQVIIKYQGGNKVSSIELIPNKTIIEAPIGCYDSETISRDEVELLRYLINMHGKLMYSATVENNNLLTELCSNSVHTTLYCKDVYSYPYLLFDCIHDGESTTSVLIPLLEDTISVYANGEFNYMYKRSKEDGMQMLDAYIGIRDKLNKIKGTTTQITGFGAEMNRDSARIYSLIFLSNTGSQIRHKVLSGKDIENIYS